MEEETLIRPKKRGVRESRAAKSAAKLGGFVRFAYDDGAFAGRATLFQGGKIVEITTDQPCVTIEGADLLLSWMLDDELAQGAAK